MKLAHPLWIKTRGNICEENLGILTALRFISEQFAVEKTDDGLKKVTHHFPLIKLRGSIVL